MRPEKKGPELTEDEKAVAELLKAAGQLALDALKTQAGLSGKKWDAAMKGLAKHGLVKVTVEGESKSV